MPPLELLIRNTSEVITAHGSPTDPAESALAPLTGGVVGIAQGRVVYLGLEQGLEPDAIGPGTEVIDAGGGFVGPGFIDPHTHFIFAGERSGEFDLRNKGASYLEIAQAGGGIMSTVRATRQATEGELAELAVPRLARMLEQGVTTAEVKSGYGLTLGDELKMLRVVHLLSRTQPIELLPTLLCAHAVPEEARNERGRYIDLCISEIIPQAAEAGLARYCDVFVENGAFTVDEGRRILRAAQMQGMAPRLHADQLSRNGGAMLAAELGALSADHLEQVDDEGIAALAIAHVTATLVPMATLFLRVKPYAPGRKLRDAGVNVALGTNVNPGSAMSENLGVTLSLACLENGLTAAEAYFGMTRGAAIALGLPEAGQVVVGGRADLVVFNCSSYRHLPYHLGVNHAKVVVKSGKVVVRATRAGMGALCR
jgi:imidazolonepropionase